MIGGESYKCAPQSTLGSVLCKERGRTKKRAVHYVPTSQLYLLLRRWGGILRLLALMNQFDTWTIVSCVCAASFILSSSLGYGWLMLTCNQLRKMLVTSFGKFPRRRGTSVGAPLSPAALSGGRSLLDRRL